MKRRFSAAIEHSGSLDQKIRLIWGEGLLKLEKQSPLCQAIYIVAKQQEEEIKRLQALVDLHAKHQD